MPKDCMEVALRNSYLADLIQRNPAVAHSFISQVDRFIELFGDDIDKLVIDGPHYSAEYDFKFFLGSENKCH